MTKGRAPMAEVIGIDHIYLAVSDLTVSTTFYDRVLLEALGFRKNAFTLGADPHVQYFNRQFGFVLLHKYRRQGVSTALMARVEQIARGLGCCKLTLQVLEGNTVARALYRANGFAGSRARPEIRKGRILATMALTMTNPRPLNPR